LQLRQDRVVTARGAPAHVLVGVEIVGCCCHGFDRSYRAYRTVRLMGPIRLPLQFQRPETGGLAPCAILQQRSRSVSAAASEAGRGLARARARGGSALALRPCYAAAG